MISLRRLSIGLGLLFAVVLVACDTTAPPPTIMPLPPSATAPAAPTVLLTAPPEPPSPTAPLPTATLPPVPTATPLPPPTSTPVALAFPLGLDTARLAALYKQAGARVAAAAPDAQLARVRLELIAFDKPALVAFTYYAPGSNTVYEARAVDGGDITTLDKGAAPNNPPAVFSSPWQPNDGWAASVAALLTEAGVRPDAAHGRWRFILQAVPGGAPWQAGFAATFAHTLAAGQVAERPLGPGQTAGAPVAVPPGDDLPFGFILNNTAIDRYYRAALRLVAAQSGSATLREVNLRLGDPADSEQATVLYHFYPPGQKQEYLATFDTGGRRDVAAQPLPTGANKTAYRESTLPWKAAPAWPGLIRLATAPFAALPASHLRLFLTARADAPTTWTLETTLVYGGQ